MKTALKRAGAENAGEKRAPRLQPQDPMIVTQLPSPGSYDPSTPACRAHQAANTKNVIALDGSKPILNLGQARKCMKAMRAILRADYGVSGCLGHTAIDYFRAFVALEDTAARGDPKYVRSLPKLAKRYFPRLSEAAQAEAIAEQQIYPVVVTARLLGELTGLTDERRDRFEFFDAEAIDMSDADRVAKRRKKEAERQRRRRKKLGATPRGECLARLREQHPDVPTATFYYDPSRYVGG